MGEFLFNILEPVETEGNDCLYYEPDENDISRLSCNDFADLDDYKNEGVYPNVKYD